MSKGSAKFQNERETVMKYEFLDYLTVFGGAAVYAVLIVHYASALFA